MWRLYQEIFIVCLNLNLFANGEESPCLDDGSGVGNLTAVTGRINCTDPSTVIVNTDITGKHLNHVEGKKNMQFGCPDVNYTTGERVGSRLYRMVMSWQECSRRCQRSRSCKYWTWQHSGRRGRKYCWTMQDAGRRVYTTRAISGQRGCSDCNCGIANRPSKIYGGQEAQPHEYPWNVYVISYRAGQWYGCGGSLISKQHVLTAAHCVDQGQRAEDIYLQLGAHNKYQPEIRAGVSKIDVPSDWDLTASSDSNRYRAPDAAILTLSQPIEYSRRIRPVCLPSDPSVTYRTKVAQATGWGRIENDVSPTNLMKVDVKVISIRTCRRSYRSVTSSIHICTTGVDASDFGTRIGDSGSPLNYPERSGRRTRYSVIGINSFKSDPDVFTKVTPELKDWIREIVPESCDP